MAKRRLELKHLKKSAQPKKGGTHKNTWKNMERIVARTFGSERTALSGGNSKVTRSDSLHPEIFIEAKLRAQLPVWDLYMTVKEQAAVEKKIPLVALKKKGQVGYLLLLHVKDLSNLAKIKEKADDDRTEQPGD